MTEPYQKYYVPEQSPWPIVGAFALFFVAIGAAMSVIQKGTDTVSGLLVLALGIGVLLYMLFGWFRHVIQESRSGLYSSQMDRSFQQGMGWFIFSEVMFFFAFFGALFYLRVFAIPWLGGDSNNAMTNEILWPEFTATWPLLLTPDGTSTQAMPWYGLPLINTIILLLSSVTLSFAHKAIEKEQRRLLVTMLGVTILLGGSFLILQIEEYIHAYQELNLTLQSGVYGNTFYLLTGFHGLHVTLGALFLLIVWVRVILGHFNSEQHFAFQAAAWYWHFVDVVWVCLFIFVYIV